MKKCYPLALLVALFMTVNSISGSVIVAGELKKWHKVTVVIDGPLLHETGTVNPFTDYRLNVTFSIGTRSVVVPGYFAADGDAGNTSADSGQVWKVHFTPDSTGTWTYTVSFRTGSLVAIDPGATAGTAVAPDGTTGTFVVAPNDKTLPDLRAKGRLEYVDQHYLKWKETGEYFIKGGSDSPENLLGYYGFDHTADSGGVTTSLNGSTSFTSGTGPYVYYGDGLHHFDPHLSDWNAGDADWGGGKGQRIIGALNYLSSRGMRAFSFLTMNINGDGREVFPYVNYNGGVAPQDDRLRFDCSKLDQWEMVFAHGLTKGLHMTIKMQEIENDDLLDGGQLGNERKVYYRELIARFGHHLALTWNLGEEYDAFNVLSDPQLLVLKSCAQYIKDLDPYDHHIVAHTYPNDWNTVYTPMLGSNSVLTGVSLQVDFADVHTLTLDWVTKSDQASRPWVVTNDEQGSANNGVRPSGATNNFANIRKFTLWGNLMAGGAGVELYFGYAYAHSDLTCEDWRSREPMWDYTKIATDFFASLPVTEMANHDELIGNPTHTNDRYCFAKPGASYVIYLPDGGTPDLDLTTESGIYDVFWFNPRTGGSLVLGSVLTVYGGAIYNLGIPPLDITEDWVAWVIYQGPTPLAASVGHFQGRQTGNEVVLNWTSAQEINVERYEVFRKGPAGTWELIGDKPASGYPQLPHMYTFIDYPVVNGTWQYQLKEIDLEGRTSFSPVVEIVFDSPTPNVTLQPNPFQDQLQLRFSGSHLGLIRMELLQPDGKVVKRRSVDMEQTDFSWNLSDLAAGPYFLKMTTTGTVELFRLLKL